jgi:hypothetical protein
LDPLLFPAPEFFPQIEFSNFSGSGFGERLFAKFENAGDLETA